MKRRKRNTGKKPYQNTCMTLQMFSRRPTLMNCHLIDHGIMLSRYYLVQNTDSIARSTPLASMNRDNSINFSKNNYALDGYAHPNHPWPHLSSLSKRKMENYYQFRITED